MGTVINSKLTSYCNPLLKQYNDLHVYYKMDRGSVIHSKTRTAEQRVKFWRGLHGPNIKFWRKLQTLCPTIMEWITARPYCNPLHNLRIFEMDYFGMDYNMVQQQFTQRAQTQGAHMNIQNTNAQPETHNQMKFHNCGL